MMNRNDDPRGHLKLLPFYTRVENDNISFHDEHNDVETDSYALTVHI